MLAVENTLAIFILLIHILHKVESTGDPPQFINPSGATSETVTEDADTSTYIFIVVAIDNEGNALTYSVRSQTPSSPSFTFDPASRKLYPPAGLDAQTATSFAIEFSVTDGNSTVISPVLTINIQDVNGHGNNQTSYITSIFGTALSGNISNIGIDNPCLPNPCENSGQCSVVGTSYQCQCSSNYAGKNCTDKAETGKDNSNGPIPIPITVVLIVDLGIILACLSLIICCAVHGYSRYIKKRKLVSPSNKNKEAKRITSITNFD